MGRGKLSMKLIGNEKSRKTTFGKRKTSLMKKASELSILCDVRTCVFVYGPYLNDQSPLEVDTWPESRDKVSELIASYKANCLHKRTRKAFDLLDFFAERKKKIEGDTSKLRKDVAEARLELVGCRGTARAASAARAGRRMPVGGWTGNRNWYRFPKWDERLDYLQEDQLHQLIVELDSKLDDTKRRMEILMENNPEEGTSAGSNQTLNSNLKQKQVMSFSEQDFGMFGSSSSSTTMETQTQSAIIPFHSHHHQYDHHHQQLENHLSQYLFGSNNNGSQFQFNQGNCNFEQQIKNPNFYLDPTNGMIMENTQQNYSLPYLYEASPLAMQFPLPYMQQLITADDQMTTMMANAQMEPSAQAQLNDQFDYFNYERFMRANNF